MLAPAEYIGQTGCRSCFASTCGHDEQVFSEALSDMFAHSADGFLLIIAVGNLIVDGNGQEIHALGSAVHEFLQIIFAEYTTDLALRATLIVPEVSFKSIGCEHHGAAAKFAFQALCVQHCLLASDVGVFTGTLGFNDRQR